MEKQPMSPGYWEWRRSNKAPLLPDVSFPAAPAGGGKARESRSGGLCRQAGYTGTERTMEWLSWYQVIFAAWSMFHPAPSGLQRRPAGAAPGPGPWARSSAASAEAPPAHSPSSDTLFTSMLS